MTILDFEKNLIDGPSLREVQGTVGIISETDGVGLQGSTYHELACQQLVSLSSAPVLASRQSISLLSAPEPDSGSQLALRPTPASVPPLAALPASLPAPSPRGLSSLRSGALFCCSSPPPRASAPLLSCTLEPCLVSASEPCQPGVSGRVDI